MQVNCTSFQAAKFRRDCVSELTSLLNSVLAITQLRYTLDGYPSDVLGLIWALAAARQVKQAQWQLSICATKADYEVMHLGLALKRNN